MHSSSCKAQAREVTNGPLVVFHPRRHYGSFCYTPEYAQAKKERFAIPLGLSPILSLHALLVLVAIAATPTPARSACPPDREAIVKDAMSPDYPDSARDLAMGPKTVVVDVSVSANGSITGLRIAESSENSAIDLAAMEAALKSTYLPKIVACKGVTGHYLFRAEFNPD